MIESFLKQYKIYNNSNNLQFNQTDTVQTRLADSIINLVCERILKKHITVDKIDKKLDYICLEFTAKNQEFAKAFTEKLVNNATDYYIDYKSQKNIANVNNIKRQVDSIRLLLYSNIGEIAESRDLNLNVILQAPQVSRQKIELNRQINGTIYAELQKNLQIAQLIKQKETPLIKIIDYPRLPLNSNKLSFQITISISIIVGLLLHLLFCFALFIFSHSKNILEV
jgi:hypothetical protein